MRKLLLGIVLSLFAYSTFAQSIIKLRATDFCYKTKSEYTGYWSQWSKWQSVNILVVINTEELRITIYSDYRQQYDIIEYYDTRVNSEGDYITEFRAIDQDGVLCGIRFVEKYNADESHLYIDYSNLKWAYNVRNLY